MTEASLVPANLEMQLAALQARFDDFVEYLPIALVEFCVADLCVTRMNLVARIVTGFTSDDILAGLSITRLATPESTALLADIWGSLAQPNLASDLPYSRRMEQNIYETTLRRKDGSLFPAEIQGSFVVDESGKPVGVQVMGRDITVRKRAEADRERLITELQVTTAEVRSLQRLLPVCAWCHKVRDDEGYWSELEHYLVDRAGASLSHGICPSCARRFMEPDEQ